MITADYTNLIIHSDSSIYDIPVFHYALRELEYSVEGINYPMIHTYKEVALEGAIFPAVEFINGWTLQFPVGNYAISGGNLKATINPVEGCYVKQTQSAAYAITSANGGMSYSLEQIADAVWTRTQRELSIQTATSTEIADAVRNKMAGDIYASALI